MASTQECMSDSFASPHPFLHLYGPACIPSDAKQIPKEEWYSVDNIWFVRRPKESNYDTLKNGSLSQPVNDDEWPHYHQMISMLVCFCLRVAEV